ncbi:MAG: hypothetical protein ABIH20_04765 [Candidatus Diapherotrites archaeon]
MFHLGKIIEVISDEEQGNKSAETQNHALVETWDENKLIFKVHPKISKELKKNDFVLIDFSPTPVSSAPVPRHEVTAIINPEKGKKLWAEMKSYLEKKKNEKREKGIPVSQDFFNQGNMIR